MIRETLLSLKQFFWSFNGLFVRSDYIDIPEIALDAYDFVFENDYFLDANNNSINLKNDSKRLNNDIKMLP